MRRSRRTDFSRCQPFKAALAEKRLQPGATTETTAVGASKGKARAFAESLQETQVRCLQRFHEVASGAESYFAMAPVPMEPSCRDRMPGMKGLPRQGVVCDVVIVHDSAIHIYALYTCVGLLRLEVDPPAMLMPPGALMTYETCVNCLSSTASMCMTTPPVVEWNMLPCVCILRSIQGRAQGSVWQFLRIWISAGCAMSSRCSTS